jgi:hypothetical protein
MKVMENDKDRSFIQAHWLISKLKIINYLKILYDLIVIVK